VSPWTANTIDFEAVQLRIHGLGIRVETNHVVRRTGDGEVEIGGIHGQPARRLEAASVVLVTMRSPHEALYRSLVDDDAGRAATGIRSLQAAGDCLTPALLSETVFAGHLAARSLDAPDTRDDPFRIEQVPTDFEPPLPWVAR